jgi:hypothetical protein
MCRQGLAYDMLTNDTGGLEREYNSTHSVYRGAGLQADRALDVYHENFVLC